MSKKNLFNITSGHLTNGQMYELFAEYNGGQIEIELITTLDNGKKVRSVIRGEIDFIVTEMINNQDAIKIIWRWCALKSKKHLRTYFLTNYRAVSFTKHKLEYFDENPRYEDSLIMLLLDEDEEEIKANPKDYYQVVRVDLISGNDPDFLPYEKILKNPKN